MSEKEPLNTEQIEFSHGTRFCVRLENGLVVAFPQSIISEEQFQVYDEKTLVALSTEEGLDLILDSLANRPDEFVIVPIDEENSWFAWGAVTEHGFDNDIVFFLRHACI